MRRAGINSVAESWRIRTGVRYGSRWWNRSSRTGSLPPIIRPMMQWNLNSNAGDVLSLGPRTAGLLATVGIRSVAELLAAQPQAVAHRLQGPSSRLFATWQCEARLIFELPQLPASAARLLAAAEIGSVEQIRCCTPTGLFARLEAAQQSCPESWLAETDLPSIAEISGWIHTAQLAEKSFAA